MDGTLCIGSTIFWLDFPYNIIQVNEKSFNFKEGIQGWYKRKETRQGWMDGCYHGDNLRIVLINRHKPYLLSKRLFGLL